MDLAAAVGGRRLLWGTTAAILLTSWVATAGERTYVVQEGDTVQRVAQVTGVSLAALLERNGLAEDAVLQVGHTLTLPDEECSARRPATYQVKPGDNLYRIAESFGLAVEALADYNQIDPKAVLQIGQSLRLPGGQEPESDEPADDEEDDPAPAPATAAKASGPAAPAAPLPAFVYVSEPRVHLRRAPSTQAESLGIYVLGTKLKVKGKAGMWWKVAEPETGRDAYVAGWIVSRTPVAAPRPAPRTTDEPLCYAFVCEPRVNVRAGAGEQTERVAVAMRGVRVAVYEVKDGWARVKFDNGTTGWVDRSLLRMPPVPDEGDAERSLGERAVRLALSYTGTPYSRGGASRGGVDCSGLVYAVFQQLGVDLPRSSRAQWGIGAPVDRGNLRPGDLVFFRNTYRSGISHVGIYIGDNKFVHAVRPGRGVQVTSLSDGYYQEHWAGAYRVTD